MNSTMEPSQLQFKSFTTYLVVTAAHLFLLEKYTFFEHKDVKDFYIQRKPQMCQGFKNWVFRRVDSFPMEL